MKIEDMSETEKDMLKDQLEACIDKATLFIINAKAASSGITEDSVNASLASAGRHANDLREDLLAFIELM